MGRKSRFNLPGIPQHVIQRGHNRDACFYANKDYRYYLDSLSAAAGKYHCHIHAYVLMTNHAHLLVTPQAAHSIPHMMQSLGRRYVRYVNDTYQRSGTLWEGRYKASLIDSQYYLLTCMRYIELNPVRARMVATPSAYPWSSFSANGNGKSDPVITPHTLYVELDQDTGRRCHAYRELFRNTLDNHLLHEIRESVNLEVVLGRSSFKDSIEEITKRQTRPGQSGRPRVKEEEAIYFVH
ncbi:MAG: transposase [Gammaproteobacteria bacterium]